MAWVDKLLGALGLARASKTKKRRRRGFRKGDAVPKFLDYSTTIGKLIEMWDGRTLSKQIFEVVNSSEKPVSLKELRERFKRSPSEISNYTRVLEEQGLLVPTSGKPKKFKRALLVKGEKK
jgi:hypothetical protein